MRSSIKMAFLGSVTVLAVILLGLLTIVSVSMRSSQMEEDVAQRLEAQGAGIAERFDNVLTRVAGKTDVLAGTEKLRAIGDATASDAASITTSVQRQQDAQKDIASASQSLAQMAMDLQQLIGHFSI